jgi:F-type H+-transporting ATPase subunit b
MLIDWFTVIAQAINFLILVWLLKRFLYKPILDAIDAREKGIAAQLAQAETKMSEAQRESADFQQKNRAFDQERAAVMTRTTNAANAEGQRLLDEARKEADALRAKRQEALRNEGRTLGKTILQWTQKEVFAITRKTLADLANADLEERMADAFVQRLCALNGEAKDQLVAAFKTATQPARVRSAFELPHLQRKAIENAIKQTFGLEPDVQFDTTPDVISGIELSTNGQKVAWTIADYLATLEKSAAELVHAEAPAKPVDQAQATSEPNGVAKPAPKPDSKNGHEQVVLGPKVNQ